jgi:hypothetical protein
MTTDTPTTLTGRKRIILDRMATQIADVLALSDQEVYPTSPPTYVEGQGPVVVQVCPGDGVPEGDGYGAQDGGGLIRRMRITTVWWFRVNLDERGKATEALTEAYVGMCDSFERVEDRLLVTTLGGLLCDMLRWEGETEPTWFDEDQGIWRCDQKWSAAYARKLSPEATIG